MSWIQRGKQTGNQQKYRIIAVDLDGHDGNDTEFTTIADQARKIAGYLRKNKIEHLYAILRMK